jgi:hypothetical protein
VVVAQDVANVGDISIGGGRLERSVTMWPSFQFRIAMMPFHLVSDYASPRTASAVISTGRPQDLEPAPAKAGSITSESVVDALRCHVALRHDMLVLVRVIIETSFLDSLRFQVKSHAL